MTIIIPDDIRLANHQRVDRWHDAETDTWTLGDWGNALAGEVGELCNVVKKIRRHQSGATQSYNTPALDVLRDKFAEETADVLLYLDLLVLKADMKPEDLLKGLRRKFNKVSIAQGWLDLLVDA